MKTADLGTSFRPFFYSINICLLEDKIQKLRYVFVHNFLTEAMLWIKDVEIVESVDDLKSSRSTKGTHGPDFELLDASIASALNKIIQNTRFKKKKVSLEEMKAQTRRPFFSRNTD